MPDRHKHKPLRFRPPETDLLWLLEHSAETGRAVNAVLSDALAAYRQSLSGPTTVAPSGPTTQANPAPSGPTTKRQARATKSPPAIPGLKPASELPRRCTHPGKRSVGGYCNECDHLIQPGGTWA